MSVASEVHHKAMSILINYKHLHLNYFVEKFITFSYAFSN